MASFSGKSLQVLKSGTLLIRDIQIYRPEGNTFGDPVDTRSIVVKFHFQREQWANVLKTLDAH